MQELLAAIVVLAGFAGGVSAIVAAVVGRHRLAVRLAVGSAAAVAIAFILGVFLRIPADERVLFLGALAVSVGLPTMGVPGVLIMMCQASAPGWTDKVLRTGGVLCAVGVVLILVGAVLAGRL
jgi:hypothetical protein